METVAVVVMVMMMMVDVVVVVVRVVRVSVLASVGVCDIHRVGGAPIGPSVQRALTFSEHRPTSPQNEQQGGAARKGRREAPAGKARAGQGPRKFVFDHRSERPAQPSTRQPLPLPLSSDRRLSH
jgi:hypothetical protein